MDENFLLDQINKLKSKLNKLENKLESYSSYNITDIGKIIAKLMHSYEGVPYKMVKHNSLYSNYDYLIIEEYESDFPINFGLESNLSRSKYGSNRGFLNSDSSADMCKLSPTILDRDQLKLPYIQKFINFLFQKRCVNNLTEISYEQLEEFLNEFLLLTKDKQLERIKERKDYLEKRMAMRKIEDFCRNCFVDRHSILSSIKQILEKYNPEILVLLHFDKSYENYGQYSKLILNEILNLEYDNSSIKYVSLVGSQNICPDEYDLGYINPKQKTSINFYELKNTLKPILNKSEKLRMFFDNIEVEFQKKMTLEEEDILNIYANLNALKLELN